MQTQWQTADCTPPAKRWLAPQFSRIAAQAGVRSGIITLVMVDDAEMARLHEAFSGVPGTTDVLTFDHRDDPDGDEPMEADLVLCVDTAGREAAARGHEARLELLLYAVHGLNHLLGGDDHTSAGAKAMHEWEDRMLTQAGFGQVYHREVMSEPAKQATRKATSQTATSKASSRKTSRPAGSAGRSSRSAGTAGLSRR